MADVLKKTGIYIERNENFSDRVCNPCARKIRNLGTLHTLIGGISQKTPEKQHTKRLFGERTPDERNKSPSGKVQRVRSAGKIASSRKSLSFVGTNNTTNVETQPMHEEDEFTSRLNIDDLPSAKELQVKVVVMSEDGKVTVRIPQDLTIKKLVNNLAWKQWKTASNLILQHEELREELKISLAKAISEEFEYYFKAGTILKATEPDELAAFSNKILVEEVRVFCPLWHHCVLGASGLKDDDIKVPGPKANSVALVSSVVARARNSTASAAQYRISSILFHSGAKYEDLIRLNRLGVCMSPNVIVAMQRKMGEQLEAKVKVWKRRIEDSRGALLLCKEVASKQNILPGTDGTDSTDNMDYEMEVDLSEETLKHYDNFTTRTYAELKTLVHVANEKRGDPSLSNRSLREVMQNLETAKLPLYK